jgi:hypothetical protein
MQMCSLRSGNSMDEYDEMFNAYIKWSKDNDVETLVLRATPMFGGPAPGAGVQFGWIDMLVAPFSVLGAGWDKWLTTKDGQKLNAQWQASAECRVSVNPAFNLHLDRDALKGDTRVMTFNWCTRRDGVTWDQMNARHAEILAGRPDDAPMKSWSIMYPGLGIRNPLGEFAHLGSYANAEGLMASQNALANEEGWRRREEYFATFANCIGQNVYHVEVLNRPK